MGLMKLLFVSLVLMSGVAFAADSKCEKLMDSVIKASGFGFSKTEISPAFNKTAYSKAGQLMSSTEMAKNALVKWSKKEMKGASKDALQKLAALKAEVDSHAKLLKDQDEEMYRHSTKSEMYKRMDAALATRETNIKRLAKELNEDIKTSDVSIQLSHDEANLAASAISGPRNFSVAIVPKAGTSLSEAMSKVSSSESVANASAVADIVNYQRFEGIKEDLRRSEVDVYKLTPEALARYQKIQNKVGGDGQTFKLANGGEETFTPDHDFNTDKFKIEMVDEYQKKLAKLSPDDREFFEKMSAHPTGMVIFSDKGIPKNITFYDGRMRREFNVNSSCELEAQQGTEIYCRRYGVVSDKLMAICPLLAPKEPTSRSPLQGEPRGVQ